MYRKLYTFLYITDIILSQLNCFVCGRSPTPAIIDILNQVYHGLDDEPYEFMIS